MPSRLLALALTMLLPSLGTSIANVALPSLETAFSASFSDVQWVVLSYLLAVTTLIVGAGRLGDLIGRRPLLLGGIGLFALASAVAALAPALWVLVTARAVQGVGAAIMMALSLAQVSEVVPKERAGSAMGLLGTVSAVGTALGPSIGGALVAWGGWSAVFGIMAVIGVITFLVGAVLFPSPSRTETRGSTFDLRGMIVLALSLGAYALSTTLGGGHMGPLNAILAGLAVIGLIAFVMIEKRTASPLVRIALLREPSLGVGLVSLGLVSAIVMTTLVVGPFYLSEALGLAPVQIGLVMSIGPGVAALVGLPAGRYVDAFGARAGAVIGLIGATMGAASMIVLPGHFGVGGYAASLATITVGYAVFQAANGATIMSAADRGDKGITSALLGLARNVGLITGASLMGAIFSIGKQGLPGLGLPAGSASGLRLCFAVAFLLAAASLALTIKFGRDRAADERR
jgi:MFS family permease